IVSALPLTIPEISPITSLQKLANLSAFLCKITACFAPDTFSAAIAFNGASFAAVEAIPNMSNKIPITTINNTMNKPIYQVEFPKTREDTLEKIAANTKVITAIVILNLMDRFNLLCMVHFPLYGIYNEGMVI